VVHSKTVNLAEYARICCPECGSDLFFALSKVRVLRHRLAPPGKLEMLVTPESQVQSCVKCNRFLRVEDCKPVDPNGETRILPP
jgi:hypothetical protein